MNPEPKSEEYVFISLKGAVYGDAPELKPTAMFMEDEGMTLVIPRSIADELGIAYESVFRCITLRVHSSLDAVGFSATIAGALAKRGISANIMAGYFHDHIFVPSERAEEALSILKELSETLKAQETRATNYP